MASPDDPARLDGADPGGTPFALLAPALLREQRTSIKWTRYPEDVLPLFVAEMDFAVAPEIRRALIERVEASDLGYIDEAGPLAPAFADFVRDRWGWEVAPSRVHLATDVATGIVESLRVFRPEGGRIALPTPVYPSFFEMLEEVPFEVVEIPLRNAAPDGEAAQDRDAAPDGEAGAAQEADPPRLDLAAIERAFASDPGIDAFLLCSPHNPHGLVHSADELAELARLAAAHDVFVISDEIHAPLVHSGVGFAPFAPLAAAAGALSVTVTSASKGWNLAGTKCSVIVAADERADAVLRRLPPETPVRASILGLHANVAAFRDARDWLDRAITRIQENDRLLADLVRDRLPGVRYTRPRAGYLAWLDFREAGLGDDPHARILREARVALNRGGAFGTGGAGHVRLNLACAPDTLRDAVDRIAAILPPQEDDRRATGSPASTPSGEQAREAGKAPGSGDPERSSASRLPSQLTTEDPE
ncbi:aminotransferase class I/II-fold pyridoxal phosphate-dependent enzyme [Leucobacter sp. CSA1]|uniref:cysteine-S-conjugate beta-lyase n=1 Tax=Leucobacter chromiisoli TaxID=2796471 RepID=A0A934QB17_9MICO|nr:aminotransferase class I/II-fold pyridoxal phosphate-dependent enzyme [Leucobacter chromiisoli]MBK0419889.1 aminotransferase class I/II-fold pyridoxal phosphate-dependent enzyme [Leucobacter chromiisoli]